jgi:hypothetical protein
MYKNPPPFLKSLQLPEAGISKSCFEQHKPPVACKHNFQCSGGSINSIAHKSCPALMPDQKLIYGPCLL